MFDKHYVGLDVVSFENTGQHKPISRVTLFVDDENCYTSGDDTGKEISAFCPSATQEIANTLLESFKENKYQSYSSEDVGIDPASELGDGITVCGIYSVISKINDDGSGFPSISAPGESEQEEEYPEAGPTQREFNRKIAQTRSLITKTAEEIRLEVQNEVESLSSSVSVQLDSITATVQGQNDKISSIVQSVDSITLNVSNDSESSVISLSIDGVEVSSQTIRFTGDVIFGSNLTDGVTVVSADNLQTGTIRADNIKLAGWLRVYNPDDEGDLVGRFGYITGTDYDGNDTVGVGMRTTARRMIVATDAGVKMCTADGHVVVTENINVETDGNLWLTGANIYSSTSITNVSDRRKKELVQYDVNRYIPIFDSLAPASFFYTEHSCGKRHLGFIAQDVEKAMLAAGIYHEEFAALSIREDGYYGLCYEEFIPLLVAKVQQLDTKIKELTA